jgi:hypothetical protein
MRLQSNMLRFLLLHSPSAFNMPLQSGMLLLLYSPSAFDKPLQSITLLLCHS